MAKKSSKSAKKSGKKGLAKLLDLVVLAVAGGMFGFLAMPFITGKISVGGLSTSVSDSGYNLLNFDADKTLAILMLLLIIFASMLAVLSIIKLCYDFNLIKEKSLGKIIGYSLVILALALFVVSVVTMIVVPGKCESHSVGGYASGGSYANWFTLVLVTAVSLGGVIASFFSVKKQ